MRVSSKKRILRMVIFDVLGFCVLAYLICAQVFRFFPFKPIDVSAELTVLATPAPATAAPTTVPTDTPVPTDAPKSTPDASSAATSGPMTDTPEATPEPTDTPEPTAEPTPEPAGLLKGKYAEKFSAEKVISNENEYRSENVAIELSKKGGYICSKCNHIFESAGTCPVCGNEIQSKTGKNGNYVTYTMADIYIQDISCLRTAYTLSGSEKKVKELCTENVGVLAINTDMYLTSLKNNHGWFVRNGVEIKRYKKIDSDLCIMYYDGTMETVDISVQSVDVDGIYAKYPQHIWFFGPALLTADGSAKKVFTTGRNVADSKNPRTAIGYYEPGHYCFIVVDGRDKDRGLDMKELSMLCADLGLKAAYNLDGGASSGMYFNGKNYGLNGRSTTDIAYIAEPNKEN